MYGVLMALPLVCFVRSLVVPSGTTRVQLTRNNSRSASPPAPSYATSSPPHSALRSSSTASSGSIESTPGPLESQDTGTT